MARRNPAVRTTKADVAQAALALFSERGYHSVTIDEIAARAGVTKGAFYYYYRDKEDLAKDLWHELWERLTAEAQEALDPESSAAENLKTAFRTVLEAMGNLGEARFFLRDAWTLPEVEVAGRADQQAAVSMVVDLLDDARRKGELLKLDTEATARVLLGAYAEAVLHILTTGKADPTLEVLDRFVDSLFSSSQHRGNGRFPKEARR
jgi:AcrR family transcriptional regulator